MGDCSSAFAACAATGKPPVTAPVLRNLIEWQTRAGNKGNTGEPNEESKPLGRHNSNQLGRHNSNQHHNAGSDGEVRIHVSRKLSLSGCKAGHLACAKGPAPQGMRFSIHLSRARKIVLEIARSHLINTPILVSAFQVRQIRGFGKARCKFYLFMRWLLV